MAVSNFDSLAVTTPISAANLAAQNQNLPFVTFIAGAQTAGALKAQYVMSFAGTISDVRAYLGTAPTVSTFILDLLKNGVSMFVTTANRPTVAISGNASTTLLPDTVTVAVGDRLSWSVLQIGSGVAGSDLSLSFTVKQANVA